MTRGDVVIEQSADRLERLADRLASQDGWRAKLAAELAEDAEFLRKLKPSLIAARARGERVVEPAPSPPPEPEESKRPQPSGPRGGPSAILIVVAAFAVGIAVAKVIDWRSHGYPRG